MVALFAQVVRSGSLDSVPEWQAAVQFAVRGLPVARFSALLNTVVSSVVTLLPPTTDGAAVGTSLRPLPRCFPDRPLLCGTHGPHTILATIDLRSPLKLEWA